MTTIFLSVTCYNVTMLTNNYYNDFFELGQQKINFNFYELSLPDDDPVYTLTGLRHLREIKITINRRNAGFFMSNFIYFYVVRGCILSLYVI